MYSEEEGTLRIVEVAKENLDFDLDVEDRLTDQYLEL